MNEKIFQPHWMSAPGATIADVLEQRKLSAEKFAELMGYSHERVRRLISGRTTITPEVAKLLEKKIGGSAEFWMSREDQYRDDVARLQSYGDHAAAKVWLSELPLKDMVRLGWIKSEASSEKQVEACLRFFDVPNVGAWRKKYGEMLTAVAFRTSPTFESRPGAVLAWLRYGEITSNQIDCGAWNAATFKSMLSTIRPLTRKKDPRQFVPELRRICASCGVAVVIARGPAGCRASGATRFISQEKAMILLSFRYLSDDQFWFTFFHEAGHLLLHSHKALFLEDESDVTSDEENEANQFAQDFLVPSASRTLLSKLPLKKWDIARFAREIGISGGIVVGQLQHIKRARPDQLNWLKRRYDWRQISHETI